MIAKQSYSFINIIISFINIFISFINIILET